MKKQITLFVMMLCFLGVAKATELWTGEVATGNWTNNVTVDKTAFAGAAAGNIIKITISEYATSAGETPITYWGFAIKKQDTGWNALSSFVDGNLTQNAANACHILTSTDVTELKGHGLAIQGYYITITKVELLTTSSSETIYNDATGTATGDYASNLNLSYDNKGKLSESFMNDFVAVTYTATGEGAIRIANPNGWEKYSAAAEKGVSNGNSGTFVYAIPNAAILENIQQGGILGRGQNITITKVELLKGSDRYDAVPATIGTDGITTFSSSKKLDFTGTGVTPYYASAVAAGTVTLTSVDKTYGYVGYMIRGVAGTYDIPVTADEVPYPTSYLRGTGDYSGNVYKSVYSDYTGGGDDETNIKTKYRYIFAKDGSSNIGFYKLATDYSRTEEATTVYYHILAAHKAYLETDTDITPKPAQGAPAIHLVFDEENNATSIEDVKQAEEAVKFFEDGKLLILRDGITYDVMGRVIR